MTMINIRNQKGLPERVTIMDFINDSNHVTVEEMAAFSKHMESIGYTRVMYSSSTDGKHQQGAWVTNEDAAIMHERFLASDRNSLGVVFPKPTVCTTLYGVLKV